MTISLTTRPTHRTDGTRAVCCRCAQNLDSSVGHARTVAIAAGWLPLDDELVCTDCQGTADRRCQR